MEEILAVSTETGVLRGSASRTDSKFKFGTQTVSPDNPCARGRAEEVGGVHCLKVSVLPSCGPSGVLHIDSDIIHDVIKVNEHRILLVNNMQ